MADRIVNIGLDRNRGKTTVDRDMVHVCMFEGDQVVWQTQEAGTFTIDFGNQSPFVKSKFDGDSGRPAKSDKPVRRGGSGDYKYTVQLTGAQPLDPGTHVDP